MTAPAPTVSAAPAFGSDEERWQAVLSRDARADGQFLYTVRSTGIYCRPGCPARTPRRDNVAFYPDRTSAEQAGYRPCKRCTPDQAGVAERQQAAVAQACRLIESADTPPALDDLAQAVGLSRFHFHRLFKALTGVTPKAYASAHRAQRMRANLGQANSVTEALFDAGFNTSGRFYAQADRVLGMTPTAYRQGGVNEQVRFAVGQCSLGAILVAATAKGVCMILLGDDPEALVRELQDRFPAAGLAGADPDFERWVAVAVGLVDTPGAHADLPLDIRGTAFQHRVWQALRAIPAGQTRSYTELAHAIGAPTAVRAVAQACASNRLAVAIPCHRVVRRTGALAGYRWGVERKRTLLDREAALHDDIDPASLRPGQRPPGRA